MKEIMKYVNLGLDIGSTTVKVVVLDEQNKLLFRSYERHYSKTRERACETLRSISDMLAGRQVKMVITGSAGLGVANASGIDFVQEVYATAAAVNQYIPDTDAVIELGGEDAYAQYLEELGVDEETFTRLQSASLLIGDMTDLTLQEGSELYLPEEGYDQYATYADHILLATQDTATGAANTVSSTARGASRNPRRMAIPRNRAGKTTSFIPRGIKSATFRSLTTRYRPFSSSPTVTLWP